jgi:hypothetical protein
VKPNLLVYDNATPLADLLRDKCIKADVETVEHGGVKYHGIVKGVPYAGDSMLDDAMGCATRTKLSFFRFNLASDTPSTFIHTDEAEGAEFAAVLHLSKIEKGGTAFWTQSQQLWNDRYGLGPDYVIPIKFNRLIIYPASRLHSRWPKETWGETRETGRLIWAAFFDAL